MESEFPGNMHICTLCLKCLQCFTKFHAPVEEGLYSQTVHYMYYIQHIAKILGLKGPKFPIKISKFWTAVLEELRLQKKTGLTN